MREAEVIRMNLTTLIVLFTTVLLLAYLVVALLYPEKF
jgi:K+-transporting ATPase KdpF subunit